ncbi:carboxymuconolactone decarboxylase family protein [Nonomuraea sp. NPDC050680]|uniref:carboxymuconolactone decarboxylase family protein n=1 Tax=Nonomuraea sp. NPDC050680 TaxID=3154630 RepID=UPI0033DD5F77
MALAALLRRLPGLRLAVAGEELSWKSGMVVRGPVSAPRHLVIISGLSHSSGPGSHMSNGRDPAGRCDSWRNAIMQARMTNPAKLVPDAMKAILALIEACKQGGVPGTTLELVHLRASQINGCSVCVDMGSRSAKKAGESDERLWAVAAWREAPYFTDAERAALALAEAVTRLSDRMDPVPDEIWDAAAKHYDEQGLSSLLLMISATNVFNRLNVATQQVAGAW